MSTDTNLTNPKGPAPQECFASRRLRARELGIAPGILPPGQLNAITDVKGVRVGHVTLIKGKDIRTGATAILPHGGNLYREKVPAGLAVGNGHGKLTGGTQVVELGEIETPIVLTNTLAVPRAADAVLDWTLGYPGNKDVRSVNPVVGETSDGRLNNIRRRVLTPKIIRRAIQTAKGGSVEEGAVGAGTGTVAFGWKAGIGVSSRILPAKLGGWTLGVLVQSNFGGVLQILGVPVLKDGSPIEKTGTQRAASASPPVGQKLGQYYLKNALDSVGGGSIMIIVATDAPLSDRNLTRLGRRAFAGLARTGASMTNNSGDYAIAFSTAKGVRRTHLRRRQVSALTELPNDLISPLFQAAIEATEEAIYNSLFKAVTVTGYRGFVAPAMPLNKVIPLMCARNCIK